jgi:hypothetical protein
MIRENTENIFKQSINIFRGVNVGPTSSQTSGNHIAYMWYGKITEIQFSESAVILLNGQMNQALFSLDG